MSEYKGKYERCDDREDEWMDKELVGVGVKFTDRTAETPEDAAYEPVTGKNQEKKKNVLNRSSFR